MSGHPQPAYQPLHSAAHSPADDPSSGPASLPPPPAHPHPSPSLPQYDESPAPLSYEHEPYGDPHHGYEDDPKVQAAEEERALTHEKADMGLDPMEVTYPPARHVQYGFVCFHSSGFSWSSSVPGFLCTRASCTYGPFCVSRFV